MMNYVISTARQTVGEHKQDIFQFEEAYAKFFSRFDLQIFILPLLTDMQSIFHLHPAMVLLPGGGDSPAEYYDSKVEVISQRHRDSIELKLIDFAINQNIPILGICRGMHMINGFLGGQLTRGTGQCHPVAVNHTIYIPGHGNIYEVNSFHRDVIEAEKLSKKLMATAFHENRHHIESFVGIEHPILGLQWHPERMDENAFGQKYSCQLVADFINNTVKGGKL